ARLCSLQQQQASVPSKASKALPSVEEAWSLPIPAELTSRQGLLNTAQQQACKQENATQTQEQDQNQNQDQNQDQSSPAKRLKRTSSPAKNSLDSWVSRPAHSCYLTAQKLQILDQLRTNRKSLKPAQLQMLEQLEAQFTQQHQMKQSVPSGPATPKSRRHCLTNPPPSSSAQTTHPPTTTTTEEAEEAEATETCLTCASTLYLTRRAQSRQRVNCTQGLHKGPPLRSPGGADLQRPFSSTAGPPPPPPHPPPPHTATSGRQQGTTKEGKPSTNGVVSPRPGGDGGGGHLEDGGTAGPKEEEEEEEEEEGLPNHVHPHHHPSTLKPGVLSSDNRHLSALSTGKANRVEGGVEVNNATSRSSPSSSSSVVSTPSPPPHHHPRRRLLHLLHSPPPPTLNGEGGPAPHSPAPTPHSPAPAPHSPALHSPAPAPHSPAPALHKLMASAAVSSSFSVSIYAGSGLSSVQEPGQERFYRTAPPC
ncbi:hypothetical protein AAFF_G00095430, partial [Aldrovandia affinis]